MFGKNIKIKEFNLKTDLNKYVNFKKEFLSEIWSESYKNHMLLNFNILRNQYLLVAMYKDEIIGQLLVSFRKKEVYIEEIEISKSFRKQGIGKKLINIFINKFQPNNLTLMVESNNKNAINFYLNLGFKKVKVIDNNILMKYR